jgi:peptide/nickel transport system substrate-binding protein
MRDGRGERYAILGTLVGIAGLLGYVALELGNVEERLLVQGQQIRALGEATDRLALLGPRSAAGGAAASAPATDEQPARMLHPEVPNYLKARDKHWPARGAVLDGTLARGWPSGDPKGFNPLLENGAEVGELLENYVSLPVADRNVWTNPDEWHGELATRVEITDDFKEFTLYLRRGVKWQAPPGVDMADPKHAWLAGEHPLTAKDLAFTLDMITNPQVEDGALKNYYAELESWKALDDTTLVVRWKKKQYPNISFTIGLAPIPEFLFAHEEDGRPIPKETVGLRFNQHWYNNKGIVGAGPYRLTSYEPGTRLRLVRSEDFVGEKPAIREISYPIYTDPQQTLLKLKAHELSVGVLTPGQYREEIQQYDGAQAKPTGSPFFDGRIRCDTNVPKFGYYYLGWNAERPLFADRRVRRAMTLALNRQQIITSVFVGLGQLSTGPYMSGSPYNDPGIAPIPYDLEAAKKLLAEAGWQDSDGDGILDRQRPGEARRTPFEFTLLLYGSSKEWTALANIFREDLLKIGVKMSIDAAEWSLMQKRMEEKSFDAFTGGWATGWDVDLYQIWHSSQADIPKGSNRVGFRNKEADALIEKVRVTFDEAERTRLFRDFHRIVNDEQPYTFLVSRRDVVCWWNDVKDVEFAKVRPAINTLPWSVARGPS